MTEPNSALDFLRHVAPETGYMNVVAIDPKEGDIEALAFTPETVAELAPFIHEHREWNLYWSTNPLRTALNKKAAKEDVAALSWVHLDLDDPSDAALERLRTYHVPPTLILFSGGGYQAFWRLRESVPINGNIEVLEAANRRVLADLDPEHPGTYNVDRIMRLPGTTNWPTATKLAKGRTGPVEARLIEFHPERQYSLAHFPVPAPEQPTKKKDQTQSADLLKKVSAAMTAGTPEDDIIRKFTTHPHAARQDDPERAVRRCIEKVERDQQNVLAEMNCKHAVVSWKGKTIILTEKIDPHFGRMTFELSGIGDFNNWYANQLLGKQTRSHWWLRHSGRRQYESVAFVPGKELQGAYNLWRGFGVQPQPGDCSLYLHMIEDVICSGNTALPQYVTTWLADAVQNPAERPGVVLVLKGAQGIGKGTFAREFGALFGTHFLHLQHAEHLIGRFNSHLANTLLLFADECFWAGDKQHEGTLKALITEPTLPIEFKGKDIITVPNYVRIVMASNKDWVVPAALNDRRFCVIDVSDKRAKDNAYFGPILAQMKAGGTAALLDHLLNFDLSKVDLRAIPETAARTEQQLRSMDAVTEFWFSRLNNGCQFSAESTWETEVVTGELYDEYAEEARLSGENRRGHETAFGMQLRKMCPELCKGEVERVVLPEHVTSGGNIRPAAKRRMKVYRFPPLADCRRAFERSAGRTFLWDTDSGAVREKEPM